MRPTSASSDRERSASGTRGAGRVTTNATKTSAATTAKTATNPMPAASGPIAVWRVGPKGGGGGGGGAGSRRRLDERRRRRQGRGADERGRLEQHPVLGRQRRRHGLAAEEVVDQPPQGRRADALAVVGAVVMGAVVIGAVERPLHDAPPRSRYRLRNARTARKKSTSKVPTVTPSASAHASRERSSTRRRRTAVR
jgi:hypothetical protein